MSNPSELIRAVFTKPNSSYNPVGRLAYVVLLIIMSGVTVVCPSGAAHSGPCAVQIAQFERQIRDVAPRGQSGPTAPQSIAAQLHHQPTLETVQNAERKANADAAAALDRARQADAPRCARVGT